MDDQRIIALFLERNEEALAITQAQYGPALLRLASRILPSREDAEEAVSDALLDAWQAIPPHRPAQLMPFLGRIVKRRAIDRYRRESAAKRGGSEMRGQPEGEPYPGRNLGKEGPGSSGGSLCEGIKGACPEYLYPTLLVSGFRGGNSRCVWLWPGTGGDDSFPQPEETVGALKRGEVERMKSEEIMEAINELGDELIAEADKPQAKKRKRFYIGAACALLAACLLIGGFFLFGNGGGLKKPKAQAATLAEPEYPPQMQWEEYHDPDTWVLEDPLYQRRARNLGAEEPFRGLFKDLILTLLSDEEQENLVMSPLNILMATAMLGEVTGGESRQEILQALGAEDLDILREQARKIWELVYYDNGVEKTIPANSLWLSRDYSYNKKTTDTLAKQYYASVFQGEMGDPAYDKLLQDWLNKQTENLLQKQVEALSFSPGTVLKLISTLYYQTKWTDEFNDANNRQLTFHGSQGDKTTTFLHQDNYLNRYFYGDKFIFLNLSTMQGACWIFLPDEGASLQEMMEEEAFQAFLENPRAEQYYRLVNDRYETVAVKGTQILDGIRINLSLPKLDFSCTQDLKECLKRLGVHSCLEAEKADYTPLLKEPGVYLQEASQTSRIILDEKGISAASYVELLAGEALPPEEELDIVIDRPFFFLITNYDAIPLYAGVVNQP